MIVCCTQQTHAKRVAGVSFFSDGLIICTGRRRGRRRRRRHETDRVFRVCRLPRRPRVFNYIFRSYATPGRVSRFGSAADACRSATEIMSAARVNVNEKIIKRKTTPGLPTTATASLFSVRRCKSFQFFSEYRDRCSDRTDNHEVCSKTESGPMSLRPTCAR